MIAQAIKSNPAFKGKLLTKALFNDYYYFKESYNGHKLSEYLDYGWEMSYSNGNFDGRLTQYLQNGMTADRLMLGGWASRFYPDPFAIGQYSVNNHLAGMMVYDITKTSQDYLSRLLRSENDQLRLDVLPGCLQDKIR